VVLSIIMVLIMKIMIMIIERMIVAMLSKTSCDVYGCRLQMQVRRQLPTP